MNNHILDGVRYIWWPIVFPGDKIMSVLGKDLLNFKPFKENAGYAPEHWKFPEIYSSSTNFSSCNDLL